MKKEDKINKLLELENAVNEKQRKSDIEEGLPHLFGQKLYEWQRQVFDSIKHVVLLCAGNQIGKSSVQIKKCIHWATEKSLWSKLWKTKPKQFWYLYPDYDTVNQEVEEKWIPEFLPRGEFKDHPKYGWKLIKDSKRVKAIYFNAGVTVYFKTYGKDTGTMQAGTVHAIFCDEELPMKHYNELMMRMSSPYVNGYFHMAFTATLGQEFWKDAVEGDTVLKEDALKLQISQYKCLYFEDGTKSEWTSEKIRQNKMKCRNKNEILKRIYGRFVKDSGLKYPTFDRDRLVIKPRKIPSSWQTVAAVDPGGGGTSHKGAMIFVAVSPNHKKGYVYKGWKGDELNDTTAGDIYDKFVEVRGKTKCTWQKYDWACKDFKTIADRAGDSFTPAEKSHDIGEGILNTLMKNNMLFFFDIPELQPLFTEFISLDVNTRKQSANDDFIDAVRYATASIIWDLSEIQEEKNVKKETEAERTLRERRGDLTKEEQERALTNDDVDEWNALYEGDW